MKKKILIAIVCCFFLFVPSVFKTFSDIKMCGFYNICEWIDYLFVVPTTYVIVSLFSKTTKHLKNICLITLGVIISILLNRDWATGFILQKMVATLFGSLFSYLIMELGKLG